MNPNVTYFKEAGYGMMMHFGLRAESMENLRQAYHLAAILESEGEIEHLRGFWESNFTEKL